MINVLIITPFYPFPSFKWIRKDSNVVYYLTKNKPKDVNLIFVHYYQSTRLDAICSLFRISKINRYTDCLCVDDRGNDILFFQHPCLFPKKTENFRYFDKKYLSLLNNYLSDKHLTIDSVITHFPSRYSFFTRLILSNRKIGIIHSFDVKNQTNMKIIGKNLQTYDRIGFRSKNIENSFNSFFKTPKRCFLCLSGIPDKQLPQGSIRNDWMDDGVLKITTVGRLDKNKNTIQIIKALEFLNSTIPVELLIIGDGEERKNLECYVKKHKIYNVIFKGNLPRDLVFSYLKKRDLFVLTSFKETLGLSYIEGISKGNLIIGGKHQGVYGLFNSQDGCYFVNQNSVFELAKTIEKIYSITQQEVNNKRMCADRKINEFSDTKLSGKYFENII